MMKPAAFDNSDSKPWAPIASVMSFVERAAQAAPDQDRAAQAAPRVLDVGAGHIPFTLATHTIDLVLKTRARGNAQSTALNLRCSRLPFEDKFFDFVFCRHTAEDMDDPRGMLLELQRVGRRGYIETPSPLAEVCRGIDGNSPPWRGYSHHRHLVWTVGSTLCILPKFAQIEHVALDDAENVRRLLVSPALANTYLMWEDSFEIRFVWDEILLNYEKGLPVQSYQEHVTSAVEAGVRSSREFLSSLLTS